MKVATLQEILSRKKAIISLTPSYNEWIVPILSIVDQKRLKPNSTVLLSQKNYSIVGVVEDNLSNALLAVKLSKLTKETFADIGGLVNQIKEIKEAIELPFTHPEYFENMGINPPKGVILYGPPGTGKTLLAKAVANSTSATFLHVVGSELVQKNAGEGSKLVREVFKLAQENAPSIIFIDQIDAIGHKRYKLFLKCTCFMQVYIFHLNVTLLCIIFIHLHSLVEKNIIQKAKKKYNELYLSY
jgi:26S protease regulatory subunit 4